MGQRRSIGAPALVLRLSARGAERAATVDAVDALWPARQRLREGEGPGRQSWVPEGAESERRPRPERHVRREGGERAATARAWPEARPEEAPAAAVSPGTVPLRVRPPLQGRVRGWLS